MFLYIISAFKASFKVILLASLGTFANSSGPSTKGYMYSLNWMFVVCPFGDIETILPSENIQEEFFLSNFPVFAFKICCISSLEMLISFDDCVMIKKISNWEIELTPDDKFIEENSFPDWYGYQKLDRK